MHFARERWSSHLTLHILTFISQQPPRGTDRILRNRLLHALYGNFAACCRQAFLLCAFLIALVVPLFVSHCHFWTRFLLLMLRRCVSSPLPFCPCLLCMEISISDTLLAICYWAFGLVKLLIRVLVKLVLFLLLPLAGVPSKCQLFNVRIVSGLCGAKVAKLDDAACEWILRRLVCRLLLSYLPVMAGQVLPRLYPSAAEPSWLCRTATGPEGTMSRDRQ